MTTRTEMREMHPESTGEVDRREFLQMVAVRQLGRILGCSVPCWSSHCSCLAAQTVTLQKRDL